MKKLTCIFLTLMCHELYAIEQLAQHTSNSITFLDVGTWIMSGFGILIFLFTVKLMPALRRTKFLLYTLTILSVMLLIAAKTIE